VLCQKKTLLVTKGGRRTVHALRGKKKRRPWTRYEALEKKKLNQHCSLGKEGLPFTIPIAGRKKERKSQARIPF